MSPVFAAHAAACWEIECWRAGALLWRDRYHNLVTTEGRNALLSSLLGAPPASVWYVGLISTSGFVAYVAADVMSSHGWTEFTDYSGSTRPAFVPGAVTNGSVNNTASKASFTISGAGGTIRGTFLTSGSGSGGTTGYLYGEGDLTAQYPIIAGDIVLALLTLTD